MLSQRKHVPVDIEHGVFPFRNIQPNLSRGDIEWLLAEHNGTVDFVGPVQWGLRGQSRREGLDLRGADLRGVDLSLLPLTHTIGGLSTRQWQGANSTQRMMAILQLERALLYEVHLEGSLLNGANFREARLSGARLQHARLADADLHHADLRGANLAYADLTRADLSGADLLRAQFKHAILDGVDLTDTVPASKLKRRKPPNEIAPISWSRETVMDWPIAQR